MIFNRNINNLYYKGIAVKISVEQTPKQKLSKYILDNVDAVSIVHLPGMNLSTTINTITSIRRTHPSVTIIPHIAARNLKNKKELFSNCEKFIDVGIDDILIIGGGNKYGSCYGGAEAVIDDLLMEGFQFNRMLCGVYPQNESYASVKENKYTKFSGGISQMCFNLKLLRKFDKDTTIGVPSNCSVKELLKFVKLCGVVRTAKETISSLRGLQYLSYSGFNTRRFAEDLRADSIHIFNFGNLEKTVKSLIKN